MGQRWAENWDRVKTVDYKERGYNKEVSLSSLAIAAWVCEDTHRAATQL